MEVGSIVEVKTDEKDFEDTSFSATVLSSKHQQIYVEYRDLLAREGGTDLLREYVDVSFVRPLPPQEIVTALSVGDVVEASFNDGWWKGAVKRVLKGGERFRIKFQTPPDEREFPLSDLRIHWDWADGVWSRPSKQAEKASVTEIGATVEVSRDSDTHYSWFRSTIRRRSKDTGALLVHFSTLKDSDGVHVRGIVDPWDVRPCSPHFQDSPFLLRQNVDAYFNFGWWSGVVSAVLDGGKYLVYVTHTRTDKLFRQTELRPHMDWENGKWIMSSQFSKVKHNTPEGFSANKTVTTSNKNSDGSILKPKTSKKPSKVTPPLSKRKKDSSDSPPSRTLKRHKEGNVVGASELDEPRDSPVTKMALGSPVPVATPLTAEDDQSPAIRSTEKTTWTKERQLIATQSGDKADFQSSPVKITTQISQGKEPSMEVRSTGVKGHNFNGKEKKLVSDQKKQPDHVAVQKLKDYAPSETRASNNKRKRGRQTPQKASKNGKDDESNAQSEKDVESNAQKRDQHIIAEKGDEVSLTHKESMLADNYHQANSPTTGSATKTISPKSSGEKLVNESMDLQRDGSTERGSKSLVGQTFESQVEGEKSLVPCTPTNENTTETISPKSNCEKLVNESMDWQPDGSTEGGSKPVNGQTYESQVEGEKSLLPYTPINGSTNKANSPKSNNEEVAKETMGLQPDDGSTGGGSKLDNGQSSESQVEGDKLLVCTPTSGSATEMTSHKRNGEKLVKESMVLQPGDGSTKGGTKPDDDQSSESQVEVKKSLVPDPETDGSATETTSPKHNGEKLVKESIGLQPDDGSTEGGSKSDNGQRSESQVEGQKAIVPDPETNGSVTETSSPIGNGEKLVKESMIVQPDELSGRGSKHIDDRTSESQVEDVPKSKTVEVIVLDADDDIMEEPLWNVVEDSGKPLSYSVEGWPSAPKVGEIQEAEEKVLVLNKTKTGEQSHSSTEKISVDTSDEQQTLPFVKSSFLWQTFESMEVFKQNPQKPHFQPLKQQKKGSREGLAIGYMVNFSNAVEKLRKLEFGDPDSIANDILDTLAELEEHGFDVGAVRDRVADIVALGDKQRKLVVEANELRSKLIVRSNEKCRIEKETCKIYEELRRLQEKASVAQMALDDENGKIASMRADLVKTEQGIEKAEREFHGLVSAKW